MRNKRQISSSSTDSSDFEIIDDNNDIEMMEPDYDDDEECIIIEENSSPKQKHIDKALVTKVEEDKNKMPWEPWTRINKKPRDEKSSDKSKNPSVLSEILGVLRYKEEVKISPKPKSRKQKNQQDSSKHCLQQRSKHRDKQKRKDVNSGNNASDHCLETENAIAEEPREFKDIKMVQETEDKIGLLIKKSKNISKKFDNTACILEENFDSLKEVFNEIDGLLCKKEATPEVIEVLDDPEEQITVVEDESCNWDPRKSKVYEHLADVYVGKIAEEFLNKTRRGRNKRVNN